MSELNNLKKSLPDMEHSFSLDEIGNITQKNFSGNFTCRISNLKIQAQIDKYRASLDGGLQGLDAGVRRLHDMIAYLRFTLTDSPKWWKDADHGYELFDISVIEAVYSKALAFEKKWIDEVWGDPEKSKEEKPSEPAKP